MAQDAAQEQKYVLGNGDMLAQCVEDWQNKKMTLEDILVKMLRSGGDDRLVLNEATGLNKYHTPAKPCAAVHRSSCTSNVSTEEGFSRGLDVLRRLIIECRNGAESEGDGMRSSPEDLFEWLLRDVRERLRTVLHLNEQDSISLFPSGTDAEFLPALLAVARCMEKKEEGNAMRALSIVTAAGEVGSGTKNAACGEHFAKLMPSGLKVGNGDKSIFDLPDFELLALEICLRDDNGFCRDASVLDAEVEAAAKKSLEQDGFGCVVVHMVVGSKTGQCMPSVACLDGLITQYGDKIIPVVDGCQGRLGEYTVSEHLRQGRIVLATGSKFFGGPPFAGACLMPAALAEELEGHLKKEDLIQAVEGGALIEYVSASLLSDDLTELRAILPEKSLNYGALLRWRIALHGMECFFAEILPKVRDELMRSWSERVQQLIIDMNSDLLEFFPQVDPASQIGDAGADDSAALSTIVSFKCRCRREGPGSAPSEMTTDELRRVQLLMATDLGDAYPELRLFGAARERCFTGQPVLLNPGAPHDRQVNVLRVAASAPLILEIARNGMDVVIDKDRLLFEKMHMILSGWSAFGKPAK